MNKIVVGCILLGFAYCNRAHVHQISSSSDIRFSQNITCAPYQVSLLSLDTGCVTSHCARFVEDGLFTDEEVSNLLDIARLGMATRESVGGPTILDINTGYIRDTNGIYI
jgi:hypothetical protein